MRRFLFITGLLCCAATLKAQLNWLLHGGYNLTSVRARYNNQTLNTEAGSGFNIGISTKALFDYNLYFSPHLRYSLKNWSVNYKNDTSVIKSAVTLHYIELPILLEMYLNPNSKNRLFVQYGPSINFAFIGREKVKLSDRTTTSRKLVFNETNWGRWEAAFMAVLGFEIKDKWMISSGFNLGLTNLVNDDFGPTLNSRTLNITISYILR